MEAMTHPIVGARRLVGSGLNRAGSVGGGDRVTLHAGTRVVGSHHLPIVLFLFGRLIHAGFVLCCHNG